MPRHDKTRKQAAADLWDRLRRGPQMGPNEAPISQPEFAARYRGWSESWILAEVARLIPELRDKLDSLGNIKNQ
jgi:hypothetical protein